MKYLSKLEKISQSKKYFLIYSKIINRGRERISSYQGNSIHYIKKLINKNNPYTYEAHHIFPKCLCKNENEKKDINNISFLTIKEHLLCHKILALKICPKHPKLLKSFFAMFSKRTIHQIYRRPTLKELELFKKESKKMHGFKGKKNGMYGKKHNKKTILKIKEKAVGRKHSSDTIRSMKMVQQKNKKENAWKQIIKYNPNIKATSYDDLEKKICKLYNNGKQNMTLISKELNFSKPHCTTIKRVLIENGLPIPSSTWSKIVKKYGYRWKNMNEFTAELKDLYSKSMNINKISKHLGLNDWIVTSSLRNSD